MGVRGMWRPGQHVSVMRGRDNLGRDSRGPGFQASQLHGKGPEAVQSLMDSRNVKKARDARAW